MISCHLERGWYTAVCQRVILETGDTEAWHDGRRFTKRGQMTEDRGSNSMLPPLPVRVPGGFDSTPTTNTQVLFPSGIIVAGIDDWVIKLAGAA